MITKAIDEENIGADGATLRYLNKKSVHKNACIHHENGEPYINPMRALGSKYVHLRINKAKINCLMSEFFEKGRRQDIRNDKMSKVLKLEAIKLAYPEIKGIDIDNINTHSLRSGGKCTTFGRIKYKKKNGTMVVRYIQGIHIKKITFILQRQ